MVLSSPNSIRRLSTTVIASIRRRHETFIELSSKCSNVNIGTHDTSDQISFEKTGLQLEEFSPEGIDTIVLNNDIY